MTLFDPARHRPLSGIDWDEHAVRAWVRRVADETHRSFSAQRWWPSHPKDREGDASDAPYTGLYMGAAGVIWGLQELAARGHATAEDEWAPFIEPLLEQNLQQVARSPWGVESLLIGQSGVLLLAFRLTGSATYAHRLHASVQRNATHPSNELLWGVPGTMHAALAMHEWTGEARWADAYRAGVATLDRAFIPDSTLECSLWTQDLYGQRVRYLGPAHGFAGNAQAILRGSHLLGEDAQRAWRERIVTTTLLTAVRAEGRVNWPAFLPEGARPADVLVDPRRMLQWCHGAPGMITSLAGVDDRRLDDVLIEAGELVWDAGALDKGGGLCHGTAGNGYALLKLHERTGETRWRDRARAFAMEAIAQCDADARQYGQRRHSLWTGDVGAALFAAACIDGLAHLPHVERDPASVRAPAGAAH